MRLLRALAVALVLVAGGAAGLAAVIVLYGGTSDPGPADAALVLGAAVYDDAPAPVFEERLRHAAGLYESGRVRVIVVTGGLAEGDRLAESEAGRAWLIAEGVPADAILVETRSRTTRQNFAFAMPLLAAHGLASVLVVSDPLHMRRAMWMAADLGIDARPSPTATSRFETLGTQVPMLLREVWFTLSYLVTRQ